MTAQIVAFAEHFGLQLERWQIRVIDRVAASRHIATIGMIRDGKVPKQLTTGIELCTCEHSWSYQDEYCPFPHWDDPVLDGRIQPRCRCRYDVHPLPSTLLPAMVSRCLIPIEDSEGRYQVAWGVWSFRIYPRCPHHGDTAYMCTCVGPVAGRGLPCPTHRIGVR